MSRYETEVSPGQRQASVDLLEATRKLMLAATTSDVDEESMRLAEQQMAVITDALGAQRRRRALRADFEGPAKMREAGPENQWHLFRFLPVAVPMKISFGEADASATFVANALFEGPHESVHGGYIAHILDCMLGTLMQARKSRSLTASLDVTYLRRTPLDQPLEAYSRIVEINGRKTTAEGWIEHQGVRTAEARGLFIAIEETAS